MQYVLLLLITVLMIASRKPAPTADQVANRKQQELKELQQARELSERYTAELLGLRRNE